MSYIERVLVLFLKNYLFGGIAKLRKRTYLPFTIIIFSVMLLNTIVGILYSFNLIFGLDFVIFCLMFELFLSFAMITSGFVVGRLKNLLLYYLIPIFIIIFYLLLFFFISWMYDNFIFQLIKLIYFLMWVGITSVTFFFITIYFFTSFPKKVITLGAPKDHIFFGFLLKVVAVVSIPFYVYLIFRFSIGNLIIGILGLIVMIVTLDLFYQAPRKQETNPGIMNFTTTIGFYNILIFYHLLMSFSTLSTSTTSFLIDIIMMFITILYIVQSMTRRIASSPERMKSNENPITFQTRLYFTDRLRNLLGERGAILIIMGLALGYHMVTLDSFFVAPLPIINDIFPFQAKFSTIYHRTYLLVSFIVLFSFIIAFFASNRVRDLLTDKYTFQQVLKYIGAFFTRENGEPSIAEMRLMEVGKKLDSGIKTLGNKLKTSLDKYKKQPDEPVE